MTFPAVVNSRDQLVLLMRTLDTLTQLPTTSSSSPMHAYFLDVCLAFSRFDCSLKTDERKLFVKCFEGLLAKLLANIKRMTAQLSLFEELTEVVTNALQAANANFGVGGGRSASGGGRICSSDLPSSSLSESPVSLIGGRSSLAATLTANNDSMSPSLAQSAPSLLFTSSGVDSVLSALADEVLALAINIFRLVPTAAHWESSATREEHPATPPSAVSGGSTLSRPYEHPANGKQNQVANPESKTSTLLQSRQRERSLACLKAYLVQFAAVAASPELPVSMASGPFVDDELEPLQIIRVASSFIAAEIEQCRKEAAMVCFRCVTTVVDLLLPASMSRGGQSASMFYRKWVIDIYRLMVDERLLGLFNLVLLSTHRRDELSSATEDEGNDGAGSNPAVSVGRMMSHSNRPLLSPLLKRGSAGASAFSAADDSTETFEMNDEAQSKCRLAEFVVSDEMTCVGSLFDRPVPHHEDAAVAGAVRIFHPTIVECAFLEQHGCLGTRLFSSVLSGLQLSGPDSLGGSITRTRTASSLEAAAVRARGGSTMGTNAAAVTTSVSPSLAAMNAVAPPMLHHHAYKYPSVHHVVDVRRLYERLLQDADLALSPHDPVRAAIVANAADCFATSCGDLQSALDLVSCYLEEVSLEGITLKVAPSAIAAAPSSTGPPLSTGAGLPSLQNNGFPATPSAFSVTVVSRSHHQQGGATPAGHPSVSTTTTVTTPTSATTPTALAASTTTTLLVPQLPQKIFSWVGKDERSQFYAVVRTLKSQQAALSKQLGLSS